MERNHPGIAPLSHFAQDSEMKTRRKMFHNNLSKSMPTMRSDADLLAEDEHIMALRFARRCERTEDDSSPLPAPTRFQKSETTMFSGVLASQRIMRSLSQPNMGCGGGQLGKIPEKSDEIIFKALRMVLYFN
jgi:hypothetical protein